MFAKLKNDESYYGIIFIVDESDDAHILLDGATDNTLLPNNESGIEKNMNLIDALEDSGEEIVDLLFEGEEMKH